MPVQISRCTEPLVTNGWAAWPLEIRTVRVASVMAAANDRVTLAEVRNRFRRGTCGMKREALRGIQAPGVRDTRVKRET